MPQCRLPSGEVIFVGSCQECDRAYNGGCFNDDEAGTIHVNIPCFVRNVLVRVLGDTLLDIGSCANVSASAIEALTIGRDTQRLQPLASDLRETLSQQVLRGIMALSATYHATIEFRDRVLLSCPRGQQLKEHYDRHLGEIYRVAARDLGLANEAAATWLMVHPFVAAMVAVARASGVGESGSVKLSSRQHERCQALLRRFHDASQDANFRSLLEELGRDLKEYESLAAAEALEKLRATPARD